MKDLLLESRPSHYDAAYFARQKQAGEFGASLNLQWFQPFIHPTDWVLDFGCGGGYLLKALNCSKKIGVEINELARAEAARLGVKTCHMIDEIPDAFANVVISNHVLEHLLSPYDTLVSLKPKVKPGGALVFVVPHQGPNERFQENDPNQHLYTWNPMTLGNLFTAAGYQVRQVEAIRCKWPPHYTRIRAATGKAIFIRLCTLYAFLRNDYQLRIVAKNP